MTACATNPDVFFSQIDSFIDYRQTVYEVSNQTTRSNIIDLNLFKRYLEKHKYRTITGEAVMGFQFYLKKTRLNAGSSVNRKLFSLRSYGTYLKTKELDGTEKLPFKDILKIRLGYRNGPQALTVDQVRTFFKHIDNKSYLGIRDYCIGALLYNLGLRIGEVWNLKVKDVDLKSKKLTVTGKGRKLRTLHITDEMAKIITDWLSVRKYFLNSDKIDNLFISKKGNPLAIRTMEDNFKKIVIASKINKNFNVTPHTLRHSFASHLNDKDVDILILQSLLGHSTPRSTEIYIHPSEKRVREALEKLPGVRYINRLIETGALRFQKQYRKRVCVKFNKKKAKAI
jgi:site-specific recombinase XerD